MPKRYLRDLFKSGSAFVLKSSGVLEQKNSANFSVSSKPIFNKKSVIMNSQISILICIALAMLAGAERSPPSVQSVTDLVKPNSYPVGVPSYGTGRAGEAQGNPIIGLSSNADFQLSAYFGQIFWGLLAVTLTTLSSVWAIRYFTGTDVFGNLVQRIRDASEFGRSLDFDRITSTVHDAIDFYEQMNGRQSRHLAQ